MKKNIVYFSLVARKNQALAVPAILGYNLFQMKTHVKKGNKGKSGQAMIEYVIVAVMLVALLSVMAVLLRATKSQSERASVLVSSDYP